MSTISDNKQDADTNNLEQTETGTLTAFDHYWAINYPTITKILR